MIGGTGGGVFEFHHGDRAITSITIWSSDLIRKIQCQYQDGTKESCGTEGGISEVFFLSAGKEICFDT